VVYWTFNKITSIPAGGCDGGGDGGGTGLSSPASGPVYNPCEEQQYA